MKGVSSLLDDVLKTIAVLSAIFLIAGYLNLKIYYDFFNIDISHFITPSEILISSIDNLLETFFWVLVQLGVWLLLFNFLFDFSNDDILKGWKDGEVRPINYDDQDESIKRLFTNKKIRVIAIILTVCFIISVFIKYLMPRSSFAI